MFIGGGEIFCTHPERPWGPPSLLYLYNGYRVFAGGKAAGAWRWPLTASSAEVKKKSRDTPLLPFCAFVACYRMNLIVTFLTMLIPTG
jgi:hypothetical protein